MKKFSTIFALAVMAFFALTSSTCSGDEPGGGGTSGGGTEGGGSTGGGSTGGGSSKKDSWYSLINENSGTLNVSGNKATWGSHTYEFSESGGQYYMKFSNIPSGYTEFEALYSKFCGDNVYRTAAMMVWAIEIYGRDAATGEKCIKLINSDSNHPGVLRELKQKFTHSPYSPSNDTYIQRYLAAAFLKDGKPSTSYKPSEPYTITMKPKKVNANPDDWSAEQYAPEIWIMSDAYSTATRAVQLLTPEHSLNNKGRVIVFNCPSLYTQCPVFTGTWGGLK